MSPPPPDVARTYLEKLHLDYAQRSNEYEEVRRLKREIELRKLQMELADLSSPVKPTRRSAEFYAEQLDVWFNNLPAAARATLKSVADFLSILKGRTPGIDERDPRISNLKGKNGESLLDESLLREQYFILGGKLSCNI